MIENMMGIFIPLHKVRRGVYQSFS